MNALNQPQRLGQSIWLDDMRRKPLRSAELHCYANDLSVTELTSNTKFFERVIVGSGDYDQTNRNRLNTMKTAEALFFELILEDLTATVGLLKPLYETNK
jgi:hypothetical protein